MSEQGGNERNKNPPWLDKIMNPETERAGQQTTAEARGSNTEPQPTYTGTAFDRSIQPSRPRSERYGDASEQFQHAPDTRQSQLSAPPPSGRYQRGPRSQIQDHRANLGDNAFYTTDTAISHPQNMAQQSTLQGQPAPLGPQAYRAAPQPGVRATPHQQSVPDNATVIQESARSKGQVVHSWKHLPDKANYGDLDSEEMELYNSIISKESKYRDVVATCTQDSSRYLKKHLRRDHGSYTLALETEWPDEKSTLVRVQSKFVNENDPNLRRAFIAQMLEKQQQLEEFEQNNSGPKKPILRVNLPPSGTFEGVNYRAPNEDLYIWVGKRGNKDLFEKEDRK